MRGIKLREESCINKQAMVQWLVAGFIIQCFRGFSGLDPGGKVELAFNPSEIGEMSSSIINAAQVCRGCADRQRSPGELLRQEFECTQPTAHSAHGLVCAAE